MTSLSTPTKKQEELEILFVIGQLQIGGTEIHLAAIAPKLARLGWRPAVFCLKEGGPLQAALERDGIAVLSPSGSTASRRSLLAKLFNLARGAWTFLALLLKRRPAIVHFFLPEPYVIGAPLAAMARIPIRIMSRRSLNLYQNGYWGAAAMERILHRTMTAILGNSQSVVHELMEKEHVPRSRLGLIYNGVDVARFSGAISRSSVRARLGVSSSALTMTVVANLIPYKGHRDLIEALGLARETLPADWNLLVVGEDRGLSDALKARATELKIVERILFLGERDDVAEILMASDIGLLCSHEEGFSNAILEGMAAGLPMIVTAVGGNPEAVIHDSSGIVVPPRDPRSLADAILRLASDPDLRVRLGDAARRRVAEHFSVERMVASYDALYRALLDGKRPCDVEQLPALDGAKSDRMSP